MKSNDFSPTGANIADSLSFPLLTCSREGMITYANSACLEALETTEKSLKTMKVHELMLGVSTFPERFAEVLKGKRYLIHDTTVGIKGKKILPVDYLEISPLAEESFPGAVVIFREKGTGTVEKFTEKGETPGDYFEIIWRGVCHEIKNPLGGIKGATQMLMRSLREDPSSSTPLEIILREVERINRFLDNLTIFHDREKRGEVNLSKTLTEAAELAAFQAREGGKKIDIGVNLDPSIPPLMGDPDGIHRVFINLLKNSLEAIEEEGKIEISMKLQEDLVIRSEDREKKYMVQVEIFDSGKPIEEEDASKLFLPFYTRKAKGTGMGLYLVKNIVEGHGGFVKIKPRKEGKSFLVYLPVPVEGGNR